MLFSPPWSVDDFSATSNNNLPIWGGTGHGSVTWKFKTW